jgi:hypothetical protein
MKEIVGENEENSMAQAEKDEEEEGEARCE